VCVPNFTLVPQINPKFGIEIVSDTHND